MKNIILNALVTLTLLLATAICIRAVCTGTLYNTNRSGTASTYHLDEDAVIGCYRKITPILISFQPGLELTDVEHGAPFDILGIGAKIQIGWPKKDSEIAWLALDPKVTSIEQLWGNENDQAPPLTPNEPENGYRALRLEDQNGNKKIDSSDAIYHGLYLWFDRDHDAVSRSEEMEPLSSRVRYISLDYQQVGQQDRHGNLIRSKAKVQLNDGTYCFSHDVFPVMAKSTIINRSSTTYDPKTIKP